ncbi:hypothetical protein GGS24DRAFT_515143 [Hypoxylon argillaceum]|nr:hypothetical protein GGS24DRAFT_515143 [Hypoxylon argillaceum]KAI1147700.1 hypothetical protein F4825DRAFT_455237 [Nemania diffusa]
MKFSNVSFLALSTSALAATINNNALGNIGKRTSPAPPIVDGGLDSRASTVKRSSPAPPIVDGGLDLSTAVKDTRAVFLVEGAGVVRN